LVKEVAERWREQLATKDISLQIMLPEEDLSVHGDAKRLSWALDNLLSNAYNYTLAGGSVGVRVFSSENEVRLHLIDTGVGVAVADQPYLFTRFFRASNQLTFNVAGVGLGLFITRSIIEAHGGRVWAESKLHEGSIFSLALPLLNET
jgi:signal transduction histidine kinase